VLYTIISKDNPYKTIVVAQAQEGILGKYIQDKFALVKKFLLIK
tara:strand:+ start:454 stop:585 length:132 start_codon:yes stop_codon:yes gene_type:complete